MSESSASDRPHIQAILGSTRQGRAIDIVARWFADRASQRDDLTVEVVDLRDFPLPHYDEPGHPAMGHVAPAAAPLIATLERADGFVFITPEYNHGVPGVLKNAFDHVHQPWRRKPAAYVGYGGLGAARAIEQLRLVNLTVQMAAIGAAVHIANFVDAFDDSGNPTNPRLDPMLDRMLSDLVWWARGLKVAREADRPAN